MYDYNYHVGTRLIIPRTDQDQLLKWDAAHLDFAPNLVFYRGMAEINPSESWSAATTYPLGSMYKHDVFGNELSGIVSELATEALENEDTLFNNWLDNPREYINMDADLMPFSVLNKLNFKDQFSIGNLAFILDEIKTPVSNSGIEGVELSVWRV